ncbi:efflux RND transporter permease subunit [Ideonella dechloratans]|uniref:Efflux pump membrane transporter n=1 Tax=Ideonella dechloratans TaxID=36863 RepID=A0A643FG80_IDEDE|nr:efflux RND transporter permease subunit [Ideonella dechloratans]KAB0584774.1 efflux RND transporter permease subunit [Ideonella dechloratans]UFU12219.1 efflux RND transporter permease subunit [Ideonella dechloratans]
MAKFFIDRPIFAWVLAILIMLAGALSILDLPLEQYPDIAPVRVSVNATYTGANAQTVEDSVTQVIEQNMKGLDGLQSMQSTSSSTGGASVTLSFIAGTNPDVAQMQVQNKVQQALTRLPQVVQSQGVTVTKSGTDFLLIANFVSDDPSVTASDLGDYVSTSLVDTLSRIDGVGDVTTLGSGYAMRIWLDPVKMQKYALMPSDISSALESQNTQVSAGQLGALPAVPGQQINAVVSARSKLRTVGQFQNVVVKSATDGALVHLGDVARVELGSDSYTFQTRYNGRPAAGVGIKLASGANALGVAKAVKAKLAELAPFFPNQIHYSIGYDTTPFVTISVEEVVKTLAEAMVLVVIVMVLFMQNLRATLIPAIAVPVVLLGTFGVLAAFGYSINTLTLFGMVLAIGLLVDDAIVVVENVERLMREEGLGPREATRKSMGEITGALIGISLVLSAVFIPMAFFGGSTGVIYRQFSITIVSSMVLSVLMALSLTPALCASLLRPHAAAGLDEDAEPAHGTVHGPASRFFAAFNRGFQRFTQRYQDFMRRTLGRAGRMMVIYGVIVAALGVSFVRLPTSFLPDEDQGLLMAMVQLPAGASAERTRAVLGQVEDYLKTQPEVTSSISLIGMSGDQASGNLFVRLKDWSQRKGRGQDAAALAGRFTKDLSGIRDARIFFMLPPAVRGLGSSAGFTVELEDLGGLGHDALLAARDQFLAAARKSPLLTQVRPSGLDDTAQLQISVDDSKAAALGLSTSDVNNTLSVALGGTYVNDFINKSRVKKVYMQGDAAYRMQPEDLNHWYVRNGSGDMVPFSAFASASWGSGPAKLERYSGMSSFEIVGSPAAGVSTGTAMAEVEKIAATLPTGITYEWAGQSFQERLSGSQAPALYALSILFVFLCLAALYESWSVPFSVMLVVPLGVIGAVLATWLAGLSNDVYFQIGLLTTVGLSAKNAILIVEFAQKLYDEGMDLMEATLQAIKLRLRPIVMTSLAFGFGVLPLAIATGAASASRRAIGTGVLGGMVTATVLGLVFIPVFYLVVRRFFRGRKAVHSTPSIPENAA